MNEQDLFLAALEIADAAQRLAYVEQACAGDSKLRRQVETLLAAHERSGMFLDVPAVNQLAGVEMTAEHSAQEKSDISFLQPSDNPGSLGRLGHYEVQEVIGRGGFGIVLRAFDEKLHRVVAIKVMAPELTTTSPARKRFLREARAAAAVKHDNVVQVYSVEEQPLPYLVMEFVEGETLQQKLDGNGPLESSELLALARQMASGLAAAHAKGLIHRDIKPVNILLEHGVEPRVKIADFGLARAANDASLTCSGLITGTPMYMSPEQARGEALDHRSDLFSLGSVLYQMASGRPPFRAQNALAVLKRVTEETPRPIQEIIPEVPDWLCAVIVKLHAKAQEDRFQTAQEVAEILAQRQPELLQDVQPPPFTLARTAHSNRLKLGVAASCFALLVVIGVGIALQSLKTDATNSDPTGEQTSSRLTESPSNDAKNSSTPTVSPNETEPTGYEYVQLFNGQDLEGWKREGNPNANWTVEDGILIGGWRPNSDFSGGSTIFTRRNDYQNFRFRIEAQLCENWASSLVFSWRDDRPRKTWYRVQIGAADGRDVLETGIVRRSLNSEPIATPDPPVRLKQNQWFTLEVVAERRRVGVYVNGVLRTEFEAAFPPSPGHLGIALSGASTIRIRRIEVRELVDQALLGNSENGGTYAWPDGTPPPAIAPFSAIQCQEHQNAWAKHLGVPVEYVNSLGIKFR